MGGSSCPRWEALAAQGGQVKIKGLTLKTRVPGETLSEHSRELVTTLLK